MSPATIPTPAAPKPQCQPMLSASRPQMIGPRNAPAFTPM